MTAVLGRELHCTRLVFERLVAVEEAKKQTDNGDAVPCTSGSEDKTFQGNTRARDVWSKKSRPLKGMRRSQQSSYAVTAVLSVQLSHLYLLTLTRRRADREARQGT